MADNDEPEIIRNEQAERFELADSPGTAFMTYRLVGDRITLVHTQVADEHEGKGIGSALVRAALGYAESEDLTVVPKCPFVRAWLDRHPDRAAELDIAVP